jgi:hypothetical protein
MKDKPYTKLNQAAWEDGSSDSLEIVLTLKTNRFSIPFI